MAFNIDLNDLTLENAGAWPDSVKRLAIAICFLFTLFLGYWLDISSQLARLTASQNMEKDLRLQFEIKQQEVINLPAYREQLTQMKKNFNTMLRKLPERTEIPGLLEDISKIGRANGLEFKGFKPESEKIQEFYAELPIQIGVLGDFHQLANFINQISALDRIVTLDGFVMEPLVVEETQNSQPERLMMEITAKTYRYTDESKK